MRELSSYLENYHPRVSPPVQVTLLYCMTTHNYSITNFYTTTCASFFTKARFRFLVVGAPFWWEWSDSPSRYRREKLHYSSLLNNVLLMARMLPLLGNLKGRHTKNAHMLTTYISLTSTRLKKNINRVCLVANWSVSNHSIDYDDVKREPLLTNNLLSDHWEPFLYGLSMSVTLVHALSHIPHSGYSTLQTTIVTITKISPHFHPHEREISPKCLEHCRMLACL